MFSRDLILGLRGRLFSNLGAFLVAGLFVATLVYTFSGSLLTKNDRGTGSSAGETQFVSVEQVQVMQKSLPAKLRIPKIDINTTFAEPLGLEVSGEVSVPDSYTQVGWYKYGPTPGELGPAVVFGHVDSYTGPAVFFYLGQLSEGDDIYIDREDGKEAHFKVSKLERYKQSEFPTELVYGNLNHAGLRLITCTGIYIKGNQRYTHNLVVYAKLVE